MLRVTLPEHSLGSACCPPDGYETEAPLPAHDPERVTEYPPAGSVTLYDVVDGENELTWFSDAALLLVSPERTKRSL
jgi:hypothetical protein